MSISRIAARQSNLWACLKYASPSPRDWAVFGVYFVPYQFTLEGKKVLKSPLFLENRNRGHGGCGRKG